METHKLCSLNPLFNLLLEHLLVHVFLRGFCVWRRSWAVKDLRNLFQTAALGFWEAEVGDRKEDCQQTAEHNVVLVANVFHADWVAESRDDQGRVDREKFTSEPFGSVCLSVTSKMPFAQGRDLPNVVGQYLC